MAISTISTIFETAENKAIATLRNISARQDRDVVSSNLDEFLEFLGCSFHRIVQVGAFGATGDKVLHFELRLWRWSPHRFHRGAGFDGHIDDRSRFLPSIRQRLLGPAWRGCAFGTSGRSRWGSAIVFHWTPLAWRSRIARAKDGPSRLVELSQRTCNRKACGSFVVVERHHVQVEGGSVPVKEGIYKPVEALLRQVPRHGAFYAFFPLYLIPHLVGCLAGKIPLDPGLAKHDLLYLFAEVRAIQL